ncbi:T9SS type A sorting domain-containing protein [candidate division KSB1 bacterium]|nr:T9SS type A sorting domain-containing protein [candidate division KSB1 bacterium]
MKALARIVFVFLLGMHFCFARSNPASFSENAIPNAAAKPMIGDLRINDDTGPADQESPAISMNKYGYGVACWEDLRSGVERIVFQLFGDKGFAYKNNIEAYSASGTVPQRDPDVAMNDLGHFVVVWDDNRDGDYDIYARKFAANGTPMGSSFKVNDDVAGRTQIYPAIAMNGDGSFIICWSEGDSVIYAQRYNSNATPLGANIRVNNSASWSRSSPDICMNEDGSFIIAWRDNRNAGVSYIYARRFSSSGTALGGDFQVNWDPIGEKRHEMPSIAIQKDGKFMVCYIIYGTVYALYAHLYNSDGTSLIDYFEIPESGASSNNIMPSVCAHPNGGFSVVWSSDKNGTYDIWARNYNNSGAPLGASSRISDVTGEQTFACLAIDERGIGVTMWEDTRNTDKDIYGFGLGTLAPLNPTAGTGFSNSVPLSWDHIYAYSAIDEYKIYRSTTAGGPYNLLATVDLSLRGILGRQMRDFIDTDVTNGTTYYYKISAIVSGVESFRSPEASATPSLSGHQILSSWSSPETAPTIDGQIVPGEWADATSVNIANPYAPSPITFYVKNDTEHLYFAIDDPNDAMLDAGNLLGIIFDEDNNNAWDAGSPSNEGLITINSAAAFYTGYWGTYPNSLGIDTPIAAGSVIKGISDTSGHIQYEAAFDLANSPLNASPGETIGLGLMIDNPSNYYAYHYGYAAEFPTGVLWESAQPLGDLKLAMATAVPGEKNTNELPQAFSLSQNFPNPFNPVTRIHYCLPASTPVTLTIYNMQGQEVRTLVNDFQSPGAKTVTWNGKDNRGQAVSSGVYIYRIDVGDFSALKKMILMH